METIEVVKKSLERKIISENYVSGMGVVTEEGRTFILVSVISEDDVAKIETSVPELVWEGHAVKVEVHPFMTPVNKTGA